MWHSLQGRVHAVDVEGDITFVAENQVGFIVLVAAAFADRAVQTTPALLQDDFGNSHIDTMRMVALATLCAHDESTLEIVPEGTAHDADVLLEGEVVLAADTDHLVLLLDGIIRACGVSLRTLEIRVN